MDEATAEQLSRYLDGDLDAAAVRRLEERLAAEPRLAAELEALRRLQRQVQAVAEHMQPPSELDAAPELPRAAGRRRFRPIPPAVRWLGLAAGVALAVTVAVEVSRGPASRPPQALPAAPTSAPAPLQRDKREPAATPPAVELREPAAGAHAEPPLPARRASRNQLPPPEAEAPPAVAPEELRSQDEGLGPAAPTEPLAADATRTDRVGEQLPAEAAPIVEAAPRERGHAAAEDRPVAFESGATGAMKSRASSGTRLVLTREDGTAVAELALPGGSASAGMTVTVTVADGVIVSVEPDGTTAAAGRALVELIGRPLPGMPDGRYRGAVVGDDAVP